MDPSHTNLLTEEQKRRKFDSFEHDRQRYHAQTYNSQGLSNLGSAGPQAPVSGMASPYYRHLTTDPVLNAKKSRLSSTSGDGNLRPNGAILPGNSADGDASGTMYPSSLETSPFAPLDQKGLSAMPVKEMHDGGLFKVEAVISHSQKLQEDIKKIGVKVKHHEDNLKFLKTQMNSIDESILDMQVKLGNNHNSSVAMEETNNVSLENSEQQMIQHILALDTSAAGIICQMKVRHGLQASKLPLTKDVLGIVATLGKVNDDKLSRIFSEFIGLETMLAIVCKTYEGVKALEKYDSEGMINQSAGLHGLGPSIGRFLDGRFLVFSLENLRPYIGEILPGDPQKRLALLKPRLPNGKCPPGFMGFAVNMINVDRTHLSCLTASGHGLRETLFYGLFSRLQVYETRAHMQSALPCISDGAISLDGGIMRTNGVFSLGVRNDVVVKFPVTSGISSLPTEVIEIEEEVKLMNWKKERLAEDMQREQALLIEVRNLFNFKSQELSDLLKGIRSTTSYLGQIPP